MAIQFSKVIFNGEKCRFNLLMDIVFKISTSDVFSIGIYCNSIFIPGCPKRAWVYTRRHADLRL